MVRRERDSLDGVLGAQRGPRRARGLGEGKVEWGPHGHVDERRFPLDGHGHARIHEAGLDTAQPALHRDLHAGGQELEGAGHHAAAARLVPRQRRPVEESDLDPCASEHERRGRARRAGTHHHDVDRVAPRRAGGPRHRRAGRQRPFHSARRFSRNARTPSWKSSLR